MSSHGLLSRRSTLLALLACGVPALAPAAEPAVVLIGHPALPRTDAATVQRLYTGRAVELAGIPVSVVNLPAGHPLRERFLVQCLQLDDERYHAYWTVRRHIGKGVPPRELAGSAEVIAFVQSTPGGIGYIDAAELRPGMNVLLRP